jgi:O-antigen/teichoic acid export membrane protein
VAVPIALGLWLAAADLIQLAFGPAFLPATLTLRVLAPLFVVTYIAIIASTCLIRLDLAWSVTLISLGGLVLTPLLNLALVRPGLAAYGVGGAGAGAAVALLVTEVSVTTAMLVRLRGEIISPDNLRSILGSVACAGVVLVLDHLTGTRLGGGRYVLDGIAYLALAIPTGALRLGELRRVVADGLRPRGAN